MNMSKPKDQMQFGLHVKLPFQAEDDVYLKTIK